MKHETDTLNKHLNPVWLGVFFLILAVASPWLDTAVSSHQFVKSYIASFGIVLLILVPLYYKCNDSGMHLKINGIKLSLILLFLLGTLSVLWSINLDFSITKWLLWLDVALIFLLVLNIQINDKELVKIAWRLVVAGGAIAIIGILQHLFDPFTLAEAAKPASTFGNRNMAI